MEGRDENAVVKRSQDGKLNKHLGTSEKLIIYDYYKMLHCNVKTTIANVSGMKTVCFSYVYKQIGRVTLPVVKLDLNEAVLRLFEKLNLKFLTLEHRSYLAGTAGC